MSPISIIPINSLNLQKKYSTLSKYAQRVIKSQCRSIRFTLERFFLNINPQLISENKQKLEEIGIKQIGKDISEGIIFSDKKNDYHVFSFNNNSLSINILEPDSNKVNQHFTLSQKTDEFMHAGNFSGSNIEDTIGNVLDFVDRKIIIAKMQLAPTKTQPLLIRQTTFQKPQKAVDVQKDSVIKNIGYIGSKEEELIKSIIEKFKLSQELYKKISDMRTKYKVRSSYKNYMPQPVANKIGFKNIGQNGESISFFDTSFKNNSHFVLSITDSEGKDQKFVISKDKKTVQKNLPSKYIKSDISEFRIRMAPDYYTQQEIDNSNLHSYLSCFNKEMELFIEHTQNWFKQREKKKLIQSNYDAANLEQYEELLTDIHSNFENYRGKLRKYLRKTNKSRKFKIENNISTKLASRSVKFDNITPEGYDLRLSYPKVGENTATQLLVMLGDNIKKSFFIINNKLLRFNIKKLSDKIIHSNQKQYYYDNKYLKESKLHSYLLLLKDKLNDLNVKLDAIRRQQIKNRIKYHIKPSKKPHNV